MKKLLFILGLFISISAFSQVTQVAELSTITQMKSYNGTTGIVFVSDSATQGFYFIYTGLGAADEVSIYAGAAGKKWRRETDPSIISQLNLKVPVTRTVNGHPLSADVTVTKSDVGLGNADNTSDINKPVSTAQQSALNAKQNLIALGSPAQYFRGDLSLATFPDFNSNVFIEGYDRVRRSSNIKYQTATDWTTIISPISNPSTRYTQTYDGSGNIIINTLNATPLGIGPLSLMDTFYNKVFYAEGEAVTADATLNPTAGFGIHINPSSSTTMDATNGIMYIWRATGSFLAYTYDATTVASSVVVSNTIGSPVAYNNGDVLGMYFSYGPSSQTTCSLTLTKNGTIVYTATISGMQVGYIGPMQRSANTSVSYKFRSFGCYAKSPLYPLTLYVDPNVTGYGDGTLTAPFSNIETVNLFAKESYSPTLNVILRAGTNRGELSIPANKFNAVTIAAANGEDVKIYGSKTINSGWTKTAGYTNVYERPHFYAGVINSTNVSGGIIDATGTTQNGVVPYTRIYTRQSPNSSLTTLDGIPYSTVVNSTDKKMYINANGTDPNTLTLELSVKDFCVDLFKSADADAYATNVKIFGIKGYFAYSHIFSLNRCNVDVQDCDAFGSNVSNGYAVNDCSGVYNRDRAIGNYNDGFNHSITTAGALPQRLNASFYDCDALYQIAGDGNSNHLGNNFTVFFGHYNYNGKDGLVPAYGDLNAYGVEAKGNADAGIAFISSPVNHNQYGNVVLCDLDSNGFYGLQVNRGDNTTVAAGSGVTSVIAKKTRFAHNPKGIDVYNTTTDNVAASTVINTYECTTEGNTVNTSIRGFAGSSSGTINGTLVASPLPTGTSSQYIKGDWSLGTFPTSNSSFSNGAGYELASNKDATGGYVGRTLFKINFPNNANTFNSLFQNTNLAARTYSWQDRDGTMADLEGNNLFTNFQTITSTAGEQLLLRYDANDTANFTVNSAGSLTMTARSSFIWNTKASSSIVWQRNGTEIARFSATNGNFLIGSSTDVAAGYKIQATGNIYTTKQMVYDGTFTTAGTTGAQTINKPVGSVNFAAGASTLVLTNSTITSAAKSAVFVQIATADATLKSCTVTIGTGTVTITGNAAATAETKVLFWVFDIP